MDTDEDRQPTAIELVETPTSLRPDLTLYGIEEIDNGITADTYENRMILRRNFISWVTIYDAEGRPSGHIEAISPEMATNRANTTLENRKAILEDPRNHNSDYLEGWDLLVVPDIDALVPPWILRATREYNKVLDSREAKPEKNLRPNLNSFPGRCHYIKSDGVRCILWHAGRVVDQKLCRVHLASTWNTAVGAVEKARHSAKQMAPRAMDVLGELMEEATSENVRGRAAEQILDRAGVRAGADVEINVNIEVKPAADLLRERLEKLTQGAKKQQELTALRDTKNEEKNETVDAEIVEDK